MRYFFIAFVFFCTVNWNLHAQSDTTGRYTISLLTCDPGDALYSTFGHSAIRVVDHVRKKDIVYNYGIFDFDTPNFYVKFVRGKLDYKLGKQTFKKFLREYEYYKRDVVENKFNLTPAEAEKMVRLLEINYKPENRYYAYDFFFDNCSSRILNVSEAATAQKIAANDSFDKDITFRQLLDIYIKGKPLSDFGIDLILGQPSDAVADFRDQMFLPDFLKLNVGLAKKTEPNGVSFLAEDKHILKFSETKEKPVFYAYPAFWTTLLFVLLVALSFWKKDHAVLRIFDGIFFTITGLAGCLFLFMWVATDHQACYANWNMLWLFPVNLIFGWTLFRKSLSPFFRNYFLMVGLLTAIAILGWWSIPQQYHIAFLPLMLIILLRIVFRNFLSDPSTKNIRA